ncbi:hypothetical protein KSS87_010706 [Heliosperma pusillum]|nr:hypothetical protein KSS87_010706 [Heliosperma pusillum]
MSHYAADFEMDEEYTIPSTSTLATPSGEAEMAELLWQNNAPVTANLVNQHLLPKLPSSLSSNSGITALPPLQNPPIDHEAGNNQLHMAVDEMASWLHYPLEDFYSELLFPNPASSTSTPDIHMPSSQSAARGFPLFSIMEWSSAPEPLLLPATTLPTVEGSNNTPISTIGDTRQGPNVVASAVASDSVVMTSTSSMGIPGGKGTAEEAMASTSSSSISTPAAATATEDTDVKTTASDMGDRKRKRIQMDDSFVAATTGTTTATLDAQNKEVELESGDEKKQLRASSSTKTKRTRAAEVHNLSERSNKASMLDEAIEYLKSLQTQVQMMSMGCGMMPMMYQGMQQQYMPPMGMGMGIGMDMGMSRQVVPYDPAMPAATTNAMPQPPMVPRLPVPPYAMPSLSTPNIRVNQPSNLADSSSSIPYAHPGPGIGQIPNMADPFQQYLAFQQMHMQMPIQMQASQSQTLSQPGSSRPDPSKSDNENEDYV